MRSLISLIDSYIERDPAAKGRIIPNSVIVAKRI